MRTPHDASSAMGYPTFERTGCSSAQQRTAQLTIPKSFLLGTKLPGILLGTKLTGSIMRAHGDSHHKMIQIILMAMFVIILDQLQAETVQRGDGSANVMRTSVLKKQSTLLVVKIVTFGNTSQAMAIAFHRPPVPPPFLLPPPASLA